MHPPLKSATVNHVLFAFQTGVIDMDNDWKLLTLLIGGNDLCQRWVMWADTKCTQSILSLWWHGLSAMTTALFPGSCMHRSMGTWLHYQHIWYFMVAFCSCCQSSGLTADEYETHLTSALEEIRQNIPRVFVNLVPMANLSQVIVLTWSAAICTKRQTKYDLLFILLAIYRYYTGSLSSPSTV